MASWAGHYHAVNSNDIAAQKGQQRGGGLHPCTLLLLNCPLSQSTMILHYEKCLPRLQQNRPKSIPLNNASLDEAFPTTSVNATSILAKKRETGLGSQRTRPQCRIENLWTCAVSHAMQQVMSLRQERTNIRPAYPNTSLTQRSSRFPVMSANGSFGCS